MVQSRSLKTRSQGFYESGFYHTEPDLLLSRLAYTFSPRAQVKRNFTFFPINSFESCLCSLLRNSRCCRNHKAKVCFSCMSAKTLIPTTPASGFPPTFEASVPPTGIFRLLISKRDSQHSRILYNTIIG